MLLSAVSVLVVAQSSSEIPEGLMNNPVLCMHLPQQLYKFSNRNSRKIKKRPSVPLQLLSVKANSLTPQIKYFKIMRLHAILGFLPEVCCAHTACRLTFCFSTCQFLKLLWNIRVTIAIKLRVWKNVPWIWMQKSLPTAGNYLSVNTAEKTLTIWILKLWICTVQICRLNDKANEPNIDTNKCTVLRWYSSIIMYPPTSFEDLCGHLQGGINKIIIMKVSEPLWWL